MTSPLQQIQLNVPLVDKEGRLTQYWVEFFTNLYTRVGGPVAQTNVQLAASIGSGGQGGPTPYFITEDSVDDMGMVVPGQPGPAGNPGATGPSGPAGFGMDGSDGDDGFPIPGPQGPQGNPGAAGASGTNGPAVYLEADLIEPDVFLVPGPAGATGSSGAAGAQGPTGPAVYLEAPEADDQIVIPGPAGSAGATGAQGPQGPAAYFVFDNSLDVDADSAAISAGSSTVQQNTPLTLAKLSTVTGITYTMGALDGTLIFNTTAACTVTLLPASAYPGRVLMAKNIAAFAITSASSNVVPLSTATAGTAFLAGAAGTFALFQSDGTNWVQIL